MLFCNNFKHDLLLVIVSMLFMFFTLGLGNTDTLDSVPLVLK